MANIIVDHVTTLLHDMHFMLNQLLSCVRQAGPVIAASVQGLPFAQKMSRGKAAACGVAATILAILVVLIIRAKLWQLYQQLSSCVVCFVETSDAISTLLGGCMRETLVMTR